MPDLTTELLKSLTASGPMGVAVYFLGRTLLKAWEEDRAQLRDVAPKSVALMQQIVAQNEQIISLLKGRT